MTEPIRARLLIVEDEVAIGNSLQAIFEHDGFKVDFAQGSDEAYQLIGKNYYDVVIADIYIHRSPAGLDILERIREQSPDTAVIIITGKESFDTVIKAWRAGALDYFRKPVNPDHLRQRIQEFLESRNIGRDICPESVQSWFGLTRREVAVLRQVLRGLSNSAIAAVLYIEEGTVKNHLTRIFKKCAVANRKELLVKLRDLST